MRSQPGHGAKGRWHAWVNRDFYRQGNDLIITSSFGDGSARKVVFSFVEWPVGEKAEPTLIGNDRDRAGNDDVTDFLQAVVDAASDFGIVAKDAENRTSELAAVRYHLEEMRKLALAPGGPR